MRDLERRLRRLEATARPVPAACGPVWTLDPQLIAEIAEFSNLALTGATEVPPHLAHLELPLETAREVAAALEAAGVLSSDPVSASAARAGGEPGPDAHPPQAMTDGESIPRAD